MKLAEAMHVCPQHLSGPQRQKLTVLKPTRVCVDTHDFCRLQKVLWRQQSALHYGRFRWGQVWPNVGLGGLHQSRSANVKSVDKKTSPVFI